MENYIFDLDGTIINSSEEVMICFEKAFAKANYQIDKTRLTPNIIGPPLLDIVKLIAPELNDENKLTEIVQNFHEVYDNDNGDISHIYDGMIELLHDLKNNGKRLFIATYKPMKPTMRIIKQFGLDMFEDVYTIDKFGEHITKARMIEDVIKRYGLLKNKTVMIGDAISDVLAAQEVGVIAIGALWGYGDNKEPLKKCSDIVFASVEKLREYAF